MADEPINWSQVIDPPTRFWGPAMKAGAKACCPNCGAKSLFNGYLKINDQCFSCGEAFHHHRADDFPPYVTIMLVGHIVVPLVLMVERQYHPEQWVHMAIWPLMTLLLALTILRPVKGALIGLQWALRLHGFGIGKDGSEPEELPGKNT